MSARKSFQDEVPRERINIKFVKQVGDAKQSIELPLKMLMIGDYSLREGGPDLADRERISVNKDNFEDVMKSMGLNLKLAVKNQLVEGDEELTVDLNFDGLDAFRPEEVAHQVPELKAIIAVRNLLSELRAHVITNRQFRRALEEIIKGDLNATIEDLDKLVPLPESLKGGAKSGGDAS